MNELIITGLVLVLILVVLMLVSAIFLLFTAFTGAPYVPTTPAIVQTMCELAELKPGQRVIDLGCGDGVILIKAAKRYGAEGIGVELSPMVALLAKIRTRLAGMQDHVKIVRGNMFDVELPEVDVVMMYLLPKATNKITNRLKARYPHMTVISHGFELKDTKQTDIRRNGKAVVRRYEW
jgi:tRNA1(Val) A37 N6-methylase TrmN6